MRTGISMLGILTALLLVGACFDPTRPCSTNADCENGGTCDPGTKTCVAAGNPDDKTAPVFSIVVTPPPSRQDTPKLNEYDPGSPDAGRGAFRRDENVVVTITSRDPDVDASSVKLMVHGVATNPGTAVEVQLGPCVASNPAASNAFCREGTVQLAPLPFEAFRAVVPLEVSGSDLSDNVGRADAGLDVTRWKWRYSAGAPIYTTPAIADDGTIVFGTSDGGSGSLYAISPGGSERWSVQGLGPTEASVAIGAGSATNSLVYVATSPSGGARINAVRLTDGIDAGVCLGASPAGFSQPIVGGLALVSTTGDNGALESAVALAGGTRLVTFRPRAQGTTDPFCLEAGAPFQQTLSETIVTDGAALYLGTEDSSLRSFVFDSSTAMNWIKNPAWGVSGAVLIGDSDLSAVALDGQDLLFTVHPFGLVRASKATGEWAALGPDAGALSDFSGPVLRGSTALFGAGPENMPRLVTLDRQSSQSQSAQSSGLVRGVPVLGAGQVAYAMTSVGGLEARASDLTLLWSGQVSLGSFRGSPSLDCARQGAGEGVLYAASDSGEVIAVVVDSAGLDSTAPWPKYQHDVRNTGNPTTPIQSCP